MTPEKMLTIHERMVHLGKLLKEEFGGEVGTVVNAHSGPSLMGFPVGADGGPSFAFTFIFSGDDPSAEGSVPPSFMSAFGGEK